MNRDSDPMDNAGLDALFAEARAAEPEPVSPEFQARLIEAAWVARPRRPGWWQRLSAAFSDPLGLPGLAGVGVAGLAGLWIGVAAPGPTADLVSTFWQGAAGVAPAAARLSANESDIFSSSGNELLSLLGDGIE